MKNNKKLLEILLAVVIVLQLCVPAAAAIYNNAYRKNLENAPTYKFRIYNLTYLTYHGDNTGSCDFLIKDLGCFGKRYCVVATDEEGFAKFNFVSKKPESGDYIEGDEFSFNFALDLYGEGSFLNELPGFENLSVVNFTDISGQLSIDIDGYITVGADEQYLEAKIYKGRIIPQRIFVDGTDMLEVMSFYNDNFDSLYDKYMNG